MFYLKVIWRTLQISMTFGFDDNNNMYIEHLTLNSKYMYVGNQRQDSEFGKVRDKARWQSAIPSSTCKENSPIEKYNQASYMYIKAGIVCPYVGYYIRTVYFHGLGGGTQKAPAHKMSLNRLSTEHRGKIFFAGLQRQCRTFLGC